MGTMAQGGLSLGATGTLTHGSPQAAGASGRCGSLQGGGLSWVASGGVPLVDALPDSDGPERRTLTRNGWSLSACTYGSTTLPFIAFASVHAAADLCKEGSPQPFEVPKKGLGAGIRLAAGREGNGDGDGNETEGQGRLGRDSHWNPFHGPSRSFDRFGREDRRRFAMGAVCELVGRLVDVGQS